MKFIKKNKMTEQELNQHAQSELFDIKSTRKLGLKFKLARAKTTILSSLLPARRQKSSRSKAGLF